MRENKVRVSYWKTCRFLWLHKRALSSCIACSSSFTFTSLVFCLFCWAVFYLFTIFVHCCKFDEVVEGIQEIAMLLTRASLDCLQLRIGWIVYPLYMKTKQNLADCYSTQQRASLDHFDLECVNLRCCWFSLDCVLNTSSILERSFKEWSYGHN